MNPTKPPNATEHPEDLLLPYVEDLLSADERARVEEHLKTCPQCAAVEEELRDIGSLLRQHREAFCPAPWELYEYLHYGVQPDAALKEHLDRCDACRALVELLKTREPADAMSAQLLDKIRSGRPRSAEIRVRGGENWWDVVYRFFRKPAFAALAAAAAVLVVFVFFPREMSQYPIAFSSVTWESVPKPKAFAPTLPRVALVLAVKECPTPLTKRSLDSLYEGLAPSMDLYEQYQILSPAMVQNTLRKSPGPIDSRERLLVGLRSQLDVSLAGLVTIECRGERYDVQVDLVDTASGTVKASRVRRGVSSSELEAEIRRATQAVLAPAGA